MSIWGTCVHAPKRTSAAEQRTRIMGQFQIALMSAMGGKRTLPLEPLSKVDDTFCLFEPDSLVESMARVVLDERV